MMGFDAGQNGGDGGGDGDGASDVGCFKLKPLQMLH